MEELQNIIIEYLNSKTFDSIGALNLNENNHSYFLHNLLKINSKILNSFIELLGINDIKFDKKVTITPLKKYIDVYIRDNKHAIIIENKIYNACDQENQLFRYKETAIEDGISEHNIIVVYLTSDGEKKISNIEQEKLAELQLKKINYKDDILPWLHKINVEFKLKIDDYINYLENFIYSSNTESYCSLYNKLNTDNEIINCVKLYKQLDDDITRKFIDWLLNEKIFNQLQNNFGFNDYETDIKHFRKSSNNIYILFYKRNWYVRFEWYIHFEYIFNLKTGTMNIELHIENKKHRETIGNELCKNELVTEIISPKGKIFYSRNISINKDFSINKEDYDAIESDIKKIEQVIDECCNHNPTTLY